MTFSLNKTKAYSCLLLSLLLLTFFGKTFLFSVLFHMETKTYSCLLLSLLLSTSWKDVFIRRFILNGKINLRLTISYQKPFVVSIPVLCFQIFIAKLILWPKTSLICNFYSKLDFGICLLYILLFFTDFELLVFDNNIVII